MSEDQAEQRDPEGRAAVRRYLVERLEMAGLIRPRRVTADAFEAQKRHLCDRLAYMTGDNLQTLAEVLIDGCQGKTDWPAEVQIMQYAHGLQAPPVAQSRIVTSWLASVEGPRAVIRGDLVELFRFVRRRLVPPAPYNLRQISDEARDNQRRRQIITENIRHEVASDEDRKWLSDYQRDYDAAMAVVDLGNARRAGVEVK